MIRRFTGVIGSVALMSATPLLIVACTPIIEPGPLASEQTQTAQQAQPAAPQFPGATQAQYIVKYEGCQVYVAEHAGNTLYLTYNIRSADQCSVTVVPGTTIPQHTTGR